jgi:hypothetical protein
MATKLKPNPLFVNILADLKKEWGYGWEVLGPNLRKALIAERLFISAASQDEEGVSDAAVRRVIKEGWTWLIEQEQV